MKARTREASDLQGDWNVWALAGWYARGPVRRDDLHRGDHPLPCREPTGFLEGLLWFGGHPARGFDVGLGPPLERNKEAIDLGCRRLSRRPSRGI